jgi:type IV pilus assembly protein PilN
MIRINLLPRKEAEVALGRRQQRALVILGAAVTVLIMLVPYLAQQRRIRRLDLDIKETQRQLDRYNEQVKEVEQLDKLKADLETKLRIIEELNKKRVGPQRVLQDLSVATPEKLWLIELSEVSGSTKIVGLALDNETIADFMRRLQRSPYFFGVDLEETTESKEQALAGFKRFSIKANVDYTGQGGVRPEQKEAVPAKAPASGEGRTAPARAAAKAK